MTLPTSSATPDLAALQPETSPYTPEPISEEDAKRLVQWVTSEYKKAKSARVAIERQWYLNMAFYYGKQNVQFLPNQMSAIGVSLSVPKAPPWRVRLVVNKIRPMIRTEVAKLTSQRPRFTVVPASTEDSDIMAARIGEQIFDSVYSSHKVRNVLRRACWWTTVCGTGYVKCYWDQNRIDEASDQVGNFVIEPVTPFHIFVPDLREQELDLQPWVIHATTKSLDWIKNTYGDTINGAKLAANTAAANEILEDAFLNLVGAQNAKQDQVLCLEAWIKPGAHKMFPAGGLVTVIGDQVAQVIRNAFPYEHGEYPFTKIDHIESGKFYGTSVIEDLIPLQKEYNRTRSQIIEAKNRMAKPQLMAPKGSINPNQMNNEPGQVILYTPGFNPPSPIQMQALPNYVLEELDRTQQDMDDIAGQHEISRGKNPSQVTAATALSFLQEQDDTKLSGTVENIEAAVEKMGRMILRYVAQFWDTPRLVRVVGDDGIFEAAEYVGRDLGTNFDIRVESGSALPTSKAAKQAFLMDLMKMGFVPPEKGLEMLELGGIEKVYDEYLTDVRQAQRENTKMEHGIPLLANAWDNHEVHVDIHNKFRKSEKFEQLSDEIKQIFEQHVMIHEMQLQAMMPPPGMEEEQGGQPSESGPPAPSAPEEPQQ